MLANTGLGASGVAGVATLVRDRHAHVDNGQCVHVAGREAKDVLDHQEGVVVVALPYCWFVEWGNEEPYIIP